MRKEQATSWRVRVLGIHGVRPWELLTGTILYLMCALMATGCATAVAFRAPQAGSQTACVVPAPEPDMVLGVALSGGGSRAAGNSS
jgi:hypothetical protein